MAFAVFEVPIEKSNLIKRVLADDLVSRQSITQRDGRALEMDEETVYLLIEGAEAAFEKAEEIFSGGARRLDSASAGKVRDKIKEEEEGAAAGVGFIFGGE